MAGDPNLYGFVEDNPTNYLDPWGFWRIYRDNDSPLANVWSDRGDTIQMLADEIGLNHTEWRHWLTISESMNEHGVLALPRRKIPISKLTSATKLCPDEGFEIPNTIVSVWCGDLGALGGRRVGGWHSGNSQLEDLGFYVKKEGIEHLRGPINSLSSVKALQGIFVVGHGSAQGFGFNNKIWSGYHGTKVTYSEFDNWTHYKIGVGIVFACSKWKSETPPVRDT